MTTLLDILQAIIKLGLPVAGLSWFLFAQLYNSDHIDRTANRKAIKSHVKSMRAAFKSKEKTRVNPVFDKWMWFGGGFYGLAALWTFVIVEISDAYNFVVHNPGREVLFSDGVVSLVFDILLNQIQNVVAAFVWFSFWDADSIPLWILIAYVGYWVGVEAARRETVLPVATWIQRIRLRLKF